MKGVWKFLNKVMESIAVTLGDLDIAAKSRPSLDPI